MGNLKPILQDYNRSPNYMGPLGSYRRLIMKIIELQKPEWEEFFDTFSKKHEDWLVSVVVNENGNQQILGDGLHLKGISVDKEEKEIILNLADNNDGITHVIDSAELVTLEQTEEGADDELFIKSEDGSFTELRFLNVALPETVDGVAS
jgi:hypothetical protein